MARSLSTYLFAWGMVAIPLFMGGCDRANTGLSSVESASSPTDRPGVPNAKGGGRWMPASSSRWVVRKAVSPPLAGESRLIPVSGGSTFERLDPLLSLATQEADLFLPEATPPPGPWIEAWQTRGVAVRVASESRDASSRRVGPSTIPRSLPLSVTVLDHQMVAFGPMPASVPDETLFLLCHDRELAESVLHGAEKLREGKANRWVAGSEQVAMATEEGWRRFVIGKLRQARHDLSFYITDPHLASELVQAAGRKVQLRGTLVVDDQVSPPLTQAIALERDVRLSVPGDLSSRWVMAWMVIDRSTCLLAWGEPAWARPNPAPSHGVGLAMELRDPHSVGWVTRWMDRSLAETNSQMSQRIERSLR